MKPNNKLFTAAFRVFLSSLMGVLILSLGMVTPVQAIEPADLKIEITDSENFVQGGTGRTYTVTVTNIGGTPTSGDVTVNVFTFPYADVSYITFGANTGWTCSPIPFDDNNDGDTDDISCHRSDELGAGAPYPPITINFDVDVDALETITSEAEVILASDTSIENNRYTLNTNVTQKPDLTIAKSESGDFEQRGVGIYTITVTNSNDFTATDGTTGIDVEITLPAKLTLKTLTAGTNWTCNNTALTCSRIVGQRVLPAGESFDDITLTVDVAVDADASVVTEVEVSGGGQVNTTNDSDDLATTIEPKPDLTITGVTRDPEAPVAYQEFVLTVSGENLGGASSGDSVFVYAFVDPAPELWPPTCGWAEDDYQEFPSNTLVDSSVPAKLPFTRDIIITDGLSAGDHDIYLYADADCIVINESYRTNNFHGPIELNIPTGNEFAINGNVGLPNVTLRYQLGGITRTELSGLNGDYEFFVPENWSGTVTPTLTGYVFSPLSKTYTNVTALQADQDYTANGSLTVRSVGAQDGWVLESSERSSVGGSFNATQTTFILGDNAQKKQYRSILSFDTAALPENARITSATLKVRKGVIAGGFNPVAKFGGFIADVRKGVFGKSPLAVGDFQAKATKTVGPFKPALVGGWYSLDLIAAKGSLNTLGTTQIRLRFNLDDNNNAIANLINFYSGNTPTLAYRPMLTINYSIP
jgi:hypothetical protein